MYFLRSAVYGNTYNHNSCTSWASLHSTSWTPGWLPGTCSSKPRSGRWWCMCRYVRWAWFASIHSPVSGWFSCVSHDQLPMTMHSCTDCISWDSLHCTVCLNVQVPLCLRKQPVDHLSADGFHTFPVSWDQLHMETHKVAFPGLLSTMCLHVQIPMCSGKLVCFKIHSPVTHHSAWQSLKIGQRSQTEP